MMKKKPDPAETASNAREKMLTKLRLVLLFNYFLWPCVTWLFYRNMPSTPIIERQKTFTWTAIIISIVVSAVGWVGVEIQSRKSKK
jgi:hypothetical protein